MVKLQIQRAQFVSRAMASNPKSINSSRIVSEDISTDSSHSLEEDSKQLVNAQHTAIISLIVSNTVAIQKEIGPRNRKLRVSLLFTPSAIFIYFEYHTTTIIITGCFDYPTSLSNFAVANKI